MLHRNIVEAGDVVIRVHKDGSYDHLSAEHESAKILAMPKDEPMILEIDYQQKIMDLRRETGWGRGRIAKELSTKGFPVTEAMVRSVLQNMGDKEEY
jgi:ribosome-binding protein aMBF1 (putative translation factor)